MIHPEEQYLGALQDILDYGEKVPSRVGATRRLLGLTHRYKFANGFPLLTTKKVWMKGIIHELLWFLSGSTNIKYLVDNGVNIWNKDAYRYYLQNPTYPSGGPYSEDEFVAYIRAQELNPRATLGEVGPGYGKQWRDWEDYSFDRTNNHDQIANLINGLKENPFDRGHILNAWNVGELDQMALRPCHVMSQYTVYGGKLWCDMIQRSCDLPLGVPFNIASYSLLTYMLAQVVGIEAGGLVHHMIDAHIYENQISAVEEQLEREPFDFPELVLNPDIKDIDSFTFDDIKIINYKHHPPIEVPLST